MSRVNTKFDIRGLVLENTSLVHMALAVSHTRKIKSKEDTAQLYVVEKQRGREAAGHKKLRQGHWGHPVTTADKRAGHWGGYIQ